MIQIAELLDFLTGQLAPGYERTSEAARQLVSEDDAIEALEDAIDAVTGGALIGK